MFHRYKMRLVHALLFSDRDFLIKNFTFSLPFLQALFRDRSLICPIVLFVLLDLLKFRLNL